MSATASSHPYDRLTPETILSATERYDVHCTGGLLALNSYENRVYRIDIEEGPPLVGKFYRPQRWSDAAILEEHSFTQELLEHEIPAVAALSHDNGQTLNQHEGFRYALFPWQPGRRPELNDKNSRELLGRYLGRMHALGRSTNFHHRPSIDITSYGYEPVDYLLQSQALPPYLETPFRTLTSDLLQQIEAAYQTAGDIATLRLHGDCHLSNILWTDSGPHIVDFDDCRMGPAIQDLWMLLDAERETMELQLADILSGYTQFMDFNPRELLLLEALRTLRLLHYSAWLASRWEDPAFPHNFPWFGSDRYWEEQILSLREQAALLNEPPLRWQR